MKGNAPLLLAGTARAWPWRLLARSHPFQGMFDSTGFELELELELTQTRMIQKQLLWVEVGKSACVLVGICELRLSLPARYDPQCPSLLDFPSGCLVHVLWIVGLRQILHGRRGDPINPNSG
jgi:hypothetical protein